MSHNHHEPETAAKSHKPALIAIVVALAVAVIAFMFFIPGSDDNDGIATTPPPADVSTTQAEGLTNDPEVVVVPEAVEGTASTVTNDGAPVVVE